VLSEESTFCGKMLSTESIFLYLCFTARLPRRVIL